MLFATGFPYVKPKVYGKEASTRRCYGRFEYKLLTAQTLDYGPAGKSTASSGSSAKGLPSRPSERLSECGRSTGSYLSVSDSPAICRAAGPVETASEYIDDESDTA
jgi:hypothetical protein